MNQPNQIQPNQIKLVFIGLTLRALQRSAGAPGNSKGVSIVLHSSSKIETRIPAEDDEKHQSSIAAFSGATTMPHSRTWYMLYRSIMCTTVAHDRHPSSTTVYGIHTPTARRKQQRRARIPLARNLFTTKQLQHGQNKVIYPVDLFKVPHGSHQKCCCSL